jgi:hypothetical protein
MREYFDREKSQTFDGFTRFELSWKRKICFGTPIACLLHGCMYGWMDVHLNMAINVGRILFIFAI